MGVEADINIIQNFLGSIFGRTEGLIEIRSLPARHQIFSRDPDEIEAFIKKHGEEDVYFGVCTRKGKNGSKAGVLEVPGLWVDLDFKDLLGGRDEALSLLFDDFPLDPSIVVASGHGFHAYWIFEEPVAACPLVECYLRGLAQALKADRSAAELARVLRLPGTFNHKFGKKAPVKLMTVTEARYALTNFEPWLVKGYDATRPNVNFRENVVGVDLERFKLSSRIGDLILQGWQRNFYKSRSEADEAVIVALLKSGATDDEIRAIFQTYPIGEKYREKGPLGDQYLAHSIGSGKAFLADRESGLADFDNQNVPVPKGMGFQKARKVQD